jgi:hypothetical protein
LYGHADQNPPQSPQYTDCSNFNNSFTYELNPPIPQDQEFYLGGTTVRITLPFSSEYQYNWEDHINMNTFQDNPNFVDVMAASAEIYFTVRITNNNGCLKKISIPISWDFFSGDPSNVNNPELTHRFCFPNSVISPLSEVTNCTALLEATADRDFYSYRWRLNDIEIPGATSKTITAVKPGYYSVLVYHNCYRTSGKFFVPLVYDLLPSFPEPLTIISNASYKVGETLHIRSGKTLKILNTTLEMGAGSKIIVENGGVLVINNAIIKDFIDCGIGWGGIEIKNGGTLILEDGAQLFVSGAGNISIEQGGKIIYHSGASINLADNSTFIEIAGELQIEPSANFTFSGNGFIRFKNNGFITNNQAQITLAGSTSGYQKKLEILNNPLTIPSNIKLAIERQALISFTNVTSSELRIEGTVELKPNAHLLWNNGRVFFQENSSLLTSANNRIITSGELSYNKNIVISNCILTLYQSAAVTGSATSFLIFENNGHLVLPAYTMEQEIRISNLLIKNGGNFDIGNFRTLKSDELTYDGGSIILNGTNAVLDIGRSSAGPNPIILGHLNISDGAEFTFSGPGLLNLTGVVNLGTGSSFKITGNNRNNLKLRANDVLFYGGKVDLSNLKMELGKAGFSGTDFNMFNVSATTSTPHLPIDYIAGITVNNPVNLNVRSSEFRNLNRGLYVINSDNAANLLISNTSFISCTTGLKAENLNKVLNISAVNINSCNKGMELINLLNASISSATLSSNNTGISASNVRGLHLSISTIRENVRGITAQHSQIFIRDNTNVFNNEQRAIELNGEYLNGAYTSLLSIGDRGCAGVYDNRGIAISGIDFLLHIDAVEHAINQGNPNAIFPIRFDKNDRTFEICYRDYGTNHSPREIYARQNYWGNQLITQNNYSIKRGQCGILHREYQVQLLTGPHSNKLCGTSIIGDHPVEMAISYCLSAKEKGGKNSISDEFQQATPPFILEDNYSTRHNYQSISDLEVESIGKNNWQVTNPNGRKEIVTEGCAHLINVAKTLTAGSEVGAIAYKTGDNIDITMEQNDIPLPLGADIKDEFLFVPNPASQSITVFYNAQEKVSELKIINLIGQELGRYSLDPSQQSLKIDLSLFESGIYFCVLVEDGKTQSIKKLVISK